MVTQEEIARRLGVSRQLVTFALSGYPKIAESSRRRILAAAEEMGYRANPHARALKQSRTGIISLWVPNQISTYYSNVARELNRLVKQAGQELIISEVDNEPSTQILSHLPVDGRFVIDVLDRAREYGQGTMGQSVPAVSMGAYCYEKMDFVQVDLLAGTRQVMKHLLGCGFRRIAHATFVPDGSEQASRREGYEQAMLRAKLPLEFIHYPLGEEQRPVIRRLIQDYIREKGHPEAIFCHSDDAAMAIYRGLCDLKLRVPDDVALVGCDGIPDTEYLECPLTTIVQPVAEMCATAWKFMSKRLVSRHLKLQRAILIPELVVRDSSRCAKR